MARFTALYEHCTLCPHQCGVDRTQGHIGRCHVDHQLRIARASLHAWEEPCLVGDHGSGTIFFVGCPASCVFCQNRVIAEGHYGQILSDPSLIKVMLKLQALGAANINLVTATPFIPHLLLAIPEARHQGLSLPIVWNSSGYESLTSLRRLDGLIDIYLPDFKYWDDDLARRYCKVSNYRSIAQAAVKEMLRQVGPPCYGSDGQLKKGVIVRQLLLPSHLQDALHVTRYLYQTYQDEIIYSLMSQYTPMPDLDAFPELQHTVARSDYDLWIDRCLELGMENAYIQEEEAASESFIPDFSSWEYRSFIDA